MPTHTTDGPVTPWPPDPSRRDLMPRSYSSNADTQAQPPSLQLTGSSRLAPAGPSARAPRHPCVSHTSHPVWASLADGVQTDAVLARWAVP